MADRWARRRFLKLWAALISSAMCVPRIQAQRLPPEDSPEPPPPHRTLKPRRPPQHARVPILMYHYISTPPPHSDRLRRNLSVPPEEFEQQLNYLRDTG
ncbi:MAG: hypothetical protein N2545_01100, partial [Thermoflexales bacterium]|nr:hypothetical protein [Thermoflexales bacterium]